ncbi:YIP1 family protein [Candidatus Woesearchaeota archaeon]|nr:YIP1 family protein [Candidatus Woesearchaeota archaeon]
MALENFVKAVKKAFSIISDPKKNFHELEKRTLEETVGYYIRTLLSMGVIAAVLNLIFSLLRALYLNVFVTIDIEYLRMLNYTLGRSSSVFFFYLYAGTFLIFFLAILLNMITKKLGFTDTMKLTLYSTTPLMVFGWIPPTPLPFAVWSLVLFVNGTKNYKITKIDKSSIKNRD